MRLGIVGCGYVFDIYMRTHWAHDELDIVGVFDTDAARLDTIARYYGLPVYASLDALLDDPSVDVVLNLTSIDSHEHVTRRSLQAGKHVYSEKPLGLTLESSRELFALAEDAEVVLAAAPCNSLTDTVTTVERLIAGGEIGRPLVVYAELDDSPAHLMGLEGVRSPTGAPFPVREELGHGCTLEHVAYHLVWLCRLFGPAVSVAAVSEVLLPDKGPAAGDVSSTPDLSIACLRFGNGVVARLTCSWVAPRNHEFRIIGSAGELVADNVFHDRSPVTVERFTSRSLSARKSHFIRRGRVLRSLLGVGGRKVVLDRHWKSHAVSREEGVSRSTKDKVKAWVRARDVYAQDKFLGVAEMVRALRDGSPQPFSPDFLLHINELTLLIHSAGSAGVVLQPSTTFTTGAGRVSGSAAERMAQRVGRDGG